jgi:hypothetical protein
MSRYAAAAEDSRTFTIKTSFEHDGPDTLNVVTMAAMHPLRPLTFSIRVGCAASVRTIEQAMLPHRVLAETGHSRFQIRPLFSRIIEWESAGSKTTSEPCRSPHRHFLPAAPARPRAGAAEQIRAVPDRFRELATRPQGTRFEEPDSKEPGSKEPGSKTGHETIMPG